MSFYLADTEGARRMLSIRCARRVPIDVQCGKVRVLTSVHLIRLKLKVGGGAATAIWMVFGTAKHYNDQSRSKPPMRL